MRSNPKTYGFHNKKKFKISLKTFDFIIAASGILKS